jgi:FkbM family methyltransferase
MRRLKQLVKRTYLYDLLRSAQVRSQLAAWTPHDQRKLELYANFLAPGDLCFDVGANIGNRVKIFLKLGARVVAVEPQPGCARVLRASFESDPRFTLIEKALGEAEGSAEMFIGEDDAVSSLSRQWVESVRSSGRFRGQRWEGRRTVAVTTLERLMAEYGVPAFVKVDVEGFEREVIRGLSRPPKALSLEFTPEVMDSTFECFERLEQLGEIRLNFSPEETMRFALDEWIDRGAMVEHLSRFRGNHEIYGDVYVRFVGA